MNAEDRAFLDTAEELGLLPAGGRARAEALVEATDASGAWTGLQQLLVEEGLLSPAQLTQALAAWADRSARLRPIQDAEAPPAAELEPPPPELAVPGFEVLRALGRSPYGPIFLGQTQDTGRLAVLKRVRHDALADEAARRRALETAARLQAVRSPHLVELLGAVELDGDLVVAAAAVQGAAVEQRLKKGLTHHDVARLGQGMARALEALHAAELPHGALRPAHVFLEHGRRVRVGGHELPLLLRAAGAQAEEPRGAASYRAPELCPGDATSPGDVYALGVILYRALADCLPGAEPRPLTEVLAAIDARLDRLVRSSLDPEPIRRPTATKLLKALDPLAAGTAMRRVTGG